MPILRKLEVSLGGLLCLLQKGVQDVDSFLPTQKSSFMADGDYTLSTFCTALKSALTERRSGEGGTWA
jgi:hypothetical protein